VRRSERQPSAFSSTLSESCVPNTPAKNVVTASKKYRLRKNYLEQKPPGIQPKSDAIKSACLRTMEVELLHYRNLLESRVKERTSILECRLSLLEHCNAKLGDNYHQIYQRYLTLLTETKNNDSTV
jgi:hypothetical protein